MALDILEGVETLITGLTWDGDQVYQLEKEMTAQASPYNTRDVTTSFTNLARNKTKFNTLASNITDYTITIIDDQLTFNQNFRSQKIGLLFTVNSGATQSGFTLFSGQSMTLNNAVDGDVINFIGSTQYVRLNTINGDVDLPVSAFNVTLDFGNTQEIVVASLDFGDSNKFIDIVIGDDGIVTNLSPVPPYQLTIQYTKA